MNTKNHYYNVKCPKDVESKFSLIVFDKEGNPCRHLTLFYQHQVGRISESSALSYLKTLFSFFTWMEEFGRYQGEHVKWNSEPLALRAVTENFLQQEVHCKIRTKDTYHLVYLTNKSPNTVNRMLSALKSFYKSMIALELYPYHNPYIDSQAILSDYNETLEGVRKGKPRLASAAGTEEPLSFRRLTDSYYKLMNKEWKPTIIDDPHLPFLVYRAGEKSNWTLRDRIICRMLFETGARATEIINLTFGDYRARTDKLEFTTFNKGSFGRRTKFLRISNDTLKLIIRYLHGERKKTDKSGIDVDALSAGTPLFLNRNGNSYTYKAFFKYWSKFMEVSDLKINIHKARHWYVTTQIREIYNTSTHEAEIKNKLEQLRIYMNWKSKATIDVYEHYFDEEKQREVHDKLMEKMAISEQEFKQMKQKKSHTKKEKKQVLPFCTKHDKHKQLFDLLD